LIFHHGFSPLIADLVAEADNAAPAGFHFLAVEDFNLHLDCIA
jgi:hypothetical protein